MIPREDQWLPCVDLSALRGMDEHQQETPWPQRINNFTVIVGPTERLDEELDSNAFSPLITHAHFMLEDYRGIFSRDYRSRWLKTCSSVEPVSIASFFNAVKLCYFVLTTVKSIRLTSLNEWGFSYIDKKFLFSCLEFLSRQIIGVDIPGWIFDEEHNVSWVTTRLRRFQVLAVSDALESVQDSIHEAVFEQLSEGQVRIVIIRSLETTLLINKVLRIGGKQIIIPIRDHH